MTLVPSTWPAFKPAKSMGGKPATGPMGKRGKSRRLGRASRIARPNSPLPTREWVLAPFRVAGKSSAKAVRTGSYAQAIG